LEVAHRAGCDFVAERVSVPVEPAEIVVTTSAGYPLDQTFYQAIKGAVGALDAVVPGGSILLLAECGEGVGSAPFTALVRGTHDLDRFVRDLYRPEQFVIDQWQLEELAKVTRKASVYLFSEGIPREVQKELFVTPVASPEEGIAELRRLYGDDARIVAIPEGPYLIPTATEVHP